MAIQSDQICFGLNDELDRASFSIFLQLCGGKQLAEVLASRASSEDIDEFVLFFTGFLKRYLSEHEYHALFLGANDNHDHSHLAENK